jgi:hypothetical protein
MYEYKRARNAPVVLFEIIFVRQKVKHVQRVCQLFFNVVIRQLIPVAFVDQHVTQQCQ